MHAPCEIHHRKTVTVHIYIQTEECTKQCVTSSNVPDIVVLETLGPSGEIYA